MEYLNKERKSLIPWSELKGEPQVQKVRGDCSQLTLAQKGKGRASERIMDYRKRRPGEFDKNEKRLTHAFLFWLG